MAKTPQRTGLRKTSAEDTKSKVSEPQAPYLSRSTKRAKSSTRRQKGYDARRYTGMIPGIADRMKKYLIDVRDDR